VVVISETSGSFAAGVAFGSGGYASFSGSGRGGIIYDGVAGITDANNDKNISIEELDFGLDLTCWTPPTRSTRWMRSPTCRPRS
jgi:hypothetical protein